MPRPRNRSWINMYKEISIYVDIHIVNFAIVQCLNVRSVSVLTLSNELFYVVTYIFSMPTIKTYMHTTWCACVAGTCSDVYTPTIPMLLYIQVT